MSEDYEYYKYISKPVGFLPMEEQWEAAQKAIKELAEFRERAMAAIEFHPRAWKLMLKRKNFVEDVYRLIRANERKLHNWNEGDEIRFLEAIYPSAEEKR
jgi:hypothetical protein